MKEPDDKVTHTIKLGSQPIAFEEIKVGTRPDAMRLLQLSGTEHRALHLLSALPHLQSCYVLFSIALL